MLVEALLQMCDRDVVDNHKSCSDYFWLMNRYAIMVTAEHNCFLFFLSNTVFFSVPTTRVPSLQNVTFSIHLIPKWLPF